MKEFTEGKMVEEVINEWEGKNSSDVDLLMRLGSGPLRAYVNNFVAYMPVKDAIYRDIVNAPETSVLKRKKEIIMLYTCIKIRKHTSYQWNKIKKLFSKNYLHHKIVYTT